MTDSPVARTDFEILPLEIAPLMRSARRWARLSQRDVAERAGLPHQTVARVESGATADPRLGTVQRILAATGCYLNVYNTRIGEICDFHPDQEKRDRGGRCYPAHLRVRPVGLPYGATGRRPGTGRVLIDPWWGWERIAWAVNDPKVPPWTFTRDRRDNPLLGDEPP